LAPRFTVSSRVGKWFCGCIEDKIEEGFENGIVEI